MNFLKNKVFISILVVILLIAGVLLFSDIGKNGFELVSPQRGDFQKIVEISGKVVPAEEVELSFNVSSNVINIYKDIGDFVEAGDILAEIDSSQVQDEIAEARANVLSAEAELTKISGTESSSSQISIAKENLVKNLNKAYINADYVIKNTVDTFFRDATTINAEFILSIGANSRTVNDGREEMQDILEEWSIENSQLNSDNLSDSDVQYALNKLKDIDAYLSLISNISSEFDPQSNVTQTQIDSYVSSIGSARSTLANILIDINNSLSTLSDLELDVPIQNAKIQNSQATVSRLRSKASDYVLRAPFAGVITDNHLEIGKYVSSSDPAFVLISDSQLEIETFIPEINIVGVDIDDTVKLKFDALPDLEIDAVVTHIDPKETVKDGVVTYRTIINLIEPNKDLKPGMSVDIEILKDSISNQLIIPSYVISSDDDGDYVEIHINGEVEKRYIEILDRNNRLEASISGNISTDDFIIVSED